MQSFSKDMALWYTPLPQRGPRAKTMPAVIFERYGSLDGAHVCAAPARPCSVPGDEYGHRWTRDVHYESRLVGSVVPWAVFRDWDWNCFNVNGY
ncbi:hypothetical protein TNCV_2390681 [Trichonephila clavipes]|nr:hypothetical protein TNCV_2390681 [Trichonephila clavipes]